MRINIIKMASIRTIFGAMECGRGLNEQMAHQALKTWVNEGYKEVDTAIMYQGGKTDKIIGKLQLCRDPTKVQIAAKANPKHGFNAEGVVKQLNDELEYLQVPSVDLFYLHWPDHDTPIEESLKGVQQLYEEGKFKRFGLSNYASWEVMEIYHICKANGYVLPSVYQGMYNALTRDIEIELIPCIRRLGMQLYVYNPLCGGLLAKDYKYEDIESDNQPKGRFFKQAWDKVYQDRFWKRSYFDGMQNIKEVITSTYGDEVTLLQAAMRWMYNHSKLSAEHGDGVILGCSKIEHLQTNIQATKGGPLHQDVVDAFDKAWSHIKSDCPFYMR